MLSGPNAGREIPLSDKKQLTIGRGKTADLIIEDRASSRINTRLAFNGMAWEISDCQSANGTFVNGDLLSDPQAVRSGDYLQIGNILMCYIDGRVEELEGQQINQVTLLRQAGKGSLGVVYEGKVQGSGQRVAVKVVGPAVTHNDAERARIINAGRRAEKLSGGYIVPVLSSGTHNDLLYVISDWAENGSLDSLLKIQDGELTPPMVIASILRDSARGLQEANSEGLIHSGLRPGNILLYRDGLTRVSDFGTTVRFDAEHHSGGIYPYYVSPEELRNRPVDAKANQFSLGAIGYHALTGEPPFADDDLAASATARLPGCLENVRIFNADIPENLAQVISRLLAVAPENRYPNWQAVIADFDAVLNGQRPQASAPSNSVMAPSRGGPRTTPRRNKAVRRGRGGAPRRQVNRRQQNQSGLIFAAVAAVVLVIIAVALVSNSGGSPQPLAADNGNDPSQYTSQPQGSGESNSYRRPETSAETRNKEQSDLASKDIEQPARVVSVRDETLDSPTGNSLSPQQEQDDSQTASPLSPPQRKIHNPKRRPTQKFLQPWQSQRMLKLPSQGSKRLSKRPQQK